MSSHLKHAVVEVATAQAKNQSETPAGLIHGPEHLIRREQIVVIKHNIVSVQDPHPTG